MRSDWVSFPVLVLVVTDVNRANMDGLKLGIRAACIWLKGDWMERTTTCWLSELERFDPPLC